MSKTKSARPKKDSKKAVRQLVEAFSDFIPDVVRDRIIEGSKSRSNAYVEVFRWLLDDGTRLNAYQVYQMFIERGVEPAGLPRPANPRWVNGTRVRLRLRIGTIPRDKKTEPEDEYADPIEEGEEGTIDVDVTPDRKRSEISQPRHPEGSGEDPALLHIHCPVVFDKHGSVYVSWTALQPIAPKAEE